MKKLYKVIYYNKFIFNKFNCNIYVIAKNKKEALNKSFAKMTENELDYPKWAELKTQIIIVADEEGNHNDYIIL